MTCSVPLLMGGKKCAGFLLTLGVQGVRGKEVKMKLGVGKKWEGGRKNILDYPATSHPASSPCPVQTKCLFLWKEYPFKMSEPAVSCKTEHWNQRDMLGLEWICHLAIAWQGWRFKLEIAETSVIWKSNFRQVKQISVERMNGQTLHT